MLKTEPFWSVVIPLYNKAPYIFATLRSVLSQTIQDFEVVVVDDGSRDNSSEVVRSFDDPRVRLIEQVNAGVSAARNRGIQEARGRFIAFLDGDDLYHPSFLATLAHLHMCHPEAKVLATSYTRTQHSDMATVEFEVINDDITSRLISNLPREFFRIGMPFCASSIAISRDRLMNLSYCFPVGEAMGEDLDLWFRLGEMGSIIFSPKEMAVYRIGVGDSLMGSFRVSELLPVWRRMESRALQGLMPPNLRKDALRLVGEMRTTLARQKMKQGYWHAAVVQQAAGWRAMVGHRWWVTTLVACTGSRSIAARLR